MKNYSSNKIHCPSSVLLSRADLRVRWGQHGSASTLRRFERSGKLKARTDGTTVVYALRNVWEFEGGQPPLGDEDYYRQPLMTDEEVAIVCPLKRSGILKAARSGCLPSRTIGRFHLFVPVEVERWLRRRWNYR